MAPPRAPADKLPLVTRKNLRDAWESKKPEFEATMKKVLGEDWSINLNPNLIYQYAGEDYQSRLGDTIVWYIEPFVDNLKKFASTFGPDGVQELNSVCSKHQLTFAPQENTTFNYGGMTINDGVLYLVFAEDAYPVNVSDVSQDFAGALKNAASASSNANAFNLIARNAVRQDYDPKIDSVRSAIRKAVNMPDLVLNPNFEAIAEELVKSKEHRENNYDARIGFIALEYFESLKYNLDRHEFEGDDMQQEAFQEAVSKGEVCLRVLPKWDDGRSGYNNLKVEDGILYLETTTEYWGVNVGDAAVKLLDIL